jgi:proteasome lid subunit RPN8/RPN11
VEQWRIPAAVVDSMIAHARREAPNECCGLLVGRERVIERSVETHNAADTPRTRYLVDPRAHFALLRELRGTTRALVGAYHSHVSSPSQPSQADIERAWTAEFLYVIVSLIDEARPDVRAFRVAGRAWVPVELATGSRP